MARLPQGEKEEAAISFKSLLRRTEILQQQVDVRHLNFVVRAVLALILGLVVSFPIKKWPSAAALAAAYLVLSGAEVATQRSFVM
ncbi:ComEC/Rec2 family competence protein [Bradyrhizobium sp. UFLA05-153]